MATRADLAKIHIAKKELALSDEAYRDCLQIHCGVDSAAKLRPGDAGVLLQHFETLGWKPRTRRGGRAGLSNPQTKQERKIVAMWIELQKAGVVNDGSDRALQRFVKRCTGSDNMRFCCREQLSAVIVGLEKWSDNF